MSGLSTSDTDTMWPGTTYDAVLSLATKTDPLPPPNYILLRRVTRPRLSAKQSKTKPGGAWTLGGGAWTLGGHGHGGGMDMGGHGHWGGAWTLGGAWAWGGAMPSSKIGLDSSPLLRMQLGRWWRAIIERRASEIDVNGLFVLGGINSHISVTKVSIQIGGHRHEEG